MGYRSEVKITICEEEFLLMHMSDTLPELLKEEVSKNYHEKHEITYWNKKSPSIYYLFEFSNIKWYSDYEYISDVEEMFNRLDKEYDENSEKHNVALYGFIRIGEDYEDIEERGEPWEYNLRVYREIEHG